MMKNLLNQLKLNKYVYKIINLNKYYYEYLLKSNIKTNQSISTLINESFTAFSGTERLQQLKDNVDESYKQLINKKELIKELKHNHVNTIENKKTIQNNIRNSLYRKSEWNADDVDSFNTLISKEHHYNESEKNMKNQLFNEERLLDNYQTHYETLLRDRYQEELLVSERNRGVSNILTWSLMIVNILMFLFSQLIFEPIRREKIKMIVVEQTNQLSTDLTNDLKEIKSNITNLLNNTKAIEMKISDSSNNSKDNHNNLNDNDHNDKYIPLVNTSNQENDDNVIDTSNNITNYFDINRSEVKGIVLFVSVSLMHIIITIINN